MTETDAPKTYTFCVSDYPDQVTVVADTVYAADGVYLFLDAKGDVVASMPVMRTLWIKATS